MKMKELLFAENKHHTGLNYTVRLGEKWKSLSIGDEVALCTVDGKEVVTAVIDMIIVCRVMDIPLEVYDLEHSDSCISWTPLKKALEKVYNRKIDINNTVTCIGYSI